MGLRFDLTMANWVASIIQEDTPSLAVERPNDEASSLEAFLAALPSSFYSSTLREADLASEVTILRRRLGSLRTKGVGSVPRDFLVSLRRMFSDRLWTALILPAGEDSEVDEFLCSKTFLEFLVKDVPWQERGLILQLDDPPEQRFSLIDLFPAFQTALAQSTKWPGILVWTRRGDSTFLPFPVLNQEGIRKAASWIIGNLSLSIGVDLQRLQSLYWSEFKQARPNRKSVLNLLQVSDLHIGSREAEMRIPRVQQLIRNVAIDLDNSSTILPVVTGDILDSPKDGYLDNARSFLDVLKNIGNEEMVVVVGNHDVRRNGVLSENFASAFSFPRTPVLWYEDHRIGLVCFNSVKKGKLARGHIGEQQFEDVGNDIDRKNNSDMYDLIGILHHHPVPVEKPAWYNQRFYERLLGRAFEQTLILEDAESFNKFAQQRSMIAVLHGHKHVPHVSKIPGVKPIPVIGCGSTVGKVPTETGTTYMSVNVISIDRSTNRISIRLLAERIPGGGLVEERRHEVVIRKRMHP